MEPTCHHKCSYVKETQGGNTDGREHRELTEEKMLAMKTEQREMQPQAKECQQPPETGRGVEGPFPKCLQPVPSGHHFVDFWPLQL